MLKGISPLLSPELLKVLDEMGHGDEIVFADANFPTVSTGKRIVRADGIGAVELLDAVLQLFPLDQYDEDHFVLMEVVPGADHLSIDQIFHGMENHVNTCIGTARIELL